MSEEISPRAVGAPQAIVVGAGPAGLMAAEVLVSRGVGVTVLERMPSPARKLLMAGRGGLNLTHSEPWAAFVQRYGAARGWLEPAIEGFGPEALKTWCADLGIETFVGSSGRVFPKAMKASPLLRAWLRRLDGQGVRLLVRHDWRGFTADGGLLVATPEGEAVMQNGVNGRFMLRGRPGVFVAGEMLDWEAPTGGYLLQACLATGRAAGIGAAEWLKRHVVVA